MSAFPDWKNIFLLKQFTNVLPDQMNFPRHILQKLPVPFVVSSSTSSYNFFKSQYFLHTMSNLHQLCRELKIIHVTAESWSTVSGHISYLTHHIREASHIRFFTLPVLWLQQSLMKLAETYIISVSFHAV